MCYSEMEGVHEQRGRYGIGHNGVQYSIRAVGRKQQGQYRAGRKVSGRKYTGKKGAQQSI